MRRIYCAQLRGSCGGYSSCFGPKTAHSEGPTWVKRQSREVLRANAPKEWCDNHVLYVKLFVITWPTTCVDVWGVKMRFTRCFRHKCQHFHMVSLGSPYDVIDLSDKWYGSRCAVPWDDYGMSFAAVRIRYSRHTELRVGGGGVKSTTLHFWHPSHRGNNMKEWRKIHVWYLVRCVITWQ